jgi:hypothetical protein
VLPVAWPARAGAYRVHVNFFQPVEKLVNKTRDGAPVHRVYDRAQTPYQRRCATGTLPSTRRAELARLYLQLNPVQLRRDLDVALERLWALAAPDPHRGHAETALVRPSPPPAPRDSPAMPLVTLSYESTVKRG